MTVYSESVAPKISLGVTLDPAEFGGAFGLPPLSHLSHNIQNASFPKVILIPAQGEPSNDFDLFRLDSSKGWVEYSKALDGHGIKLNRSGLGIPFAFLPEASVTATLQNDYGESFLQKTTDIAGEGMGQLAQMVGGRTTEEVFKNLGKTLGRAGEDMTKDGGMVSSLIGGGLGAGQSAMRGLSKLAGSMTGSKLGAIIDKLATNHRFDFPQIWRNSSFNQNQTLTIRFYNPRPSSDKAHKKYILGPLALLLLLASPRSDVEYGYNWPLFIRALAPGYFTLKAAGISNITVVQGGDQNQLTLAGPRVAVLDVRVELVNLYNTTVDDSQAPDDKMLQDKPNIATYLGALANDTTFNLHRGVRGEVQEGDILTPLYGSIVRDDANLMASKFSGENNPVTAERLQNVNSELQARAKNAVSLPQTIEDSENRFVSSSRIPQDIKNKQDELIAQKEDFYNRNV